MKYILLYSVNIFSLQNNHTFITIPKLLKSVVSNTYLDTKVEKRKRKIRLYPQFIDCNKHFYSCASIGQGGGSYLANVQRLLLAQGSFPTMSEGPCDAKMKSGPSTCKVYPQPFKLSSQPCVNYCLLLSFTKKNNEFKVLLVFNGYYKEPLYCTTSSWYHKDKFPSQKIETKE